MNKMYINRWLHNKVKKVFKNFNVLVITGARQTGKSTFLKNDIFFKNFNYFSFDDYTILKIIKDSPEEILEEYENIIIDEVQKYPKILDTIKFYVDNYPSKHFILTGSSNILLMKNLSESLAGRAVYLSMYPFSIKESLGKKFNSLENLFKGILEPNNIVKFNSDILFKGLMPKIITENFDLTSVNLWLEGYVKTYIERDLFDIAKIQYLPDFYSMLSILSHNIGNILNESNIANQCRLTQPTTHRYINLLEILNVVYKLKPYTKNTKKRIVKSPKLFFIDNALARYLSGYYEEIDKKNKGKLFENIFFIMLKIYSSLLNPEAQLYFYRDKSGNEIDFICEWGNKKIGFEVKYSSKVSMRDAAILINLKKELNLEFCYLIYAGNEIVKLSKSVIALPIGYF